MNYVNILNVAVLDNPTAFVNPFQFEITFECTQQLQEDLEWRVVYVGNHEDNAYDQVLEELSVGPVPVGINRFVLQTSVGPNANNILNEHLIGVTVILISCSYMNQKFVQVGYYIRNEYAEPFDENSYPNPVDITKLYRNVVAHEPHVTVTPINWEGVIENYTYDGIQIGETADLQVDALDEQSGDGVDDEIDNVDEDENGEIDLEATAAIDYGSHNHHEFLMDEDSMDVNLMQTNSLLTAPHIY